MFKSFLFLTNFENAQKNIMKSANFFFLFYTVQCTKRRCSEMIKLQLKVEIEDRPKAQVLYINYVKLTFSLAPFSKFLPKN